MSAEIRSCEDALRFLALYLDRELEGSLEKELEHHLSTCLSCYSRAEFERRLKGQLATLHEEPVSPGLTERVRRLMRELTIAGDATPPARLP